MLPQVQVQTVTKPLGKWASYCPAPKKKTPKSRERKGERGKSESNVKETNPKFRKYLHKVRSFVFNSRA